MLLLVVTHPISGSVRLHRERGSRLDHEEVLAGACTQVVLEHVAVLLLNGRTAPVRGTNKGRPEATVRLLLHTVAQGMSHSLVITLIVPLYILVEPRLLLIGDGRQSLEFGPVRLRDVKTYQARAFSVGTLVGNGSDSFDAVDLLIARDLVKPFKSEVRLNWFVAQLSHKNLVRAAALMRQHGTFHHLALVRVATLLNCRGVRFPDSLEVGLGVRGLERAHLDLLVILLQQSKPLGLRSFLRSASEARAGHFEHIDVVGEFVLELPMQLRVVVLKAYKVFPSLNKLPLQLLLLR